MPCVRMPIASNNTSEKLMNKLFLNPKFIEMMVENEIKKRNIDKELIELIDTYRTEIEKCLNEEE
jgi:hypothetical protein